MSKADTHSSDITGAIDHAETPYLTFSRSQNLPIWSILPQKCLQDTEKQMLAVLTKSQVHSALITIMTNVAHFSLVVQEAKKGPRGNVLLDPNAFAEDLYWIEYKLLSFPKELHVEIPERTIEKACRIGALLYLKNILQEFPHSMTGSSILLARLREALSGVAKDDLVMPTMVWVCMVGALLARDERKWFLGRLRESRETMRAATYDELAGEMSVVLSLKSAFGDDQCQSVWHEIVDARGDGNVEQ